MRVEESSPTLRPVNGKYLILGASGFLGAVVLSGCSGDSAGSGLTLPIVRSVPESTAPQGSTTSLPFFEEAYTIQIGDTLFEIAQIFGVTVEDLISFNGIADPDAIESGQVLKIPSPVNPSGTTVPQTTSAP